MDEAKSLSTERRSEDRVESRRRRVEKRPGDPALNTTGGSGSRPGPKCSKRELRSSSSSLSKHADGASVEKEAAPKSADDTAKSIYDDAVLAVIMEDSPEHPADKENREWGRRPRT